MGRIRTPSPTHSWMVRKFALRAEAERSTQARVRWSVDMVVKRCEKRPAQQGAREGGSSHETKRSEEPEKTKTMTSSGNHSPSPTPAKHISQRAEDQASSSEPSPGVLDRALALVEFLRENCPWDAEQTPESLIPHLLEEAQYVVDAIRGNDLHDLEGELGDLLLNLAFQVVVGEERGNFDRESVTRRLEEKMERRHPHLFGLGEKEDWEEMKVRERGEGTRVLHGLAKGLDPLLKAHRIQDRVSGVGFDWSDPSGAWQKVAEELEEVGVALEGGIQEEVEEELGDLLFSVVNLTRLAGAHPDTVLDRANRKFQQRFEDLEDLAKDRGISLPDATLEVLDGLWEELKRER